MFTSILLLLLLTVFVVAVFRRLGLPLILGYFVVGMTIGPKALGWVGNDATLKWLAEFGVVFLLFIIGLEFSLPRLIRMRHALLGLGSVQVVICTLVAWFLGITLGLTWQAALVVAGALSLSSTAVVTKTLSEQNEIHTVHGHYTLSILLFQDLAVVPFLILIPALIGATGESLWVTLTWAVIKGTAAVTMLLLLGAYGLRRLFHEIAMTHSKELFTLTVLLIALTAAWFTFQLGLSMALGAFVAGMMLGGTEFRHEIESDMRPFQDVLLGLFFITIGMLLDVNIFLHKWYWILLLVLAMLVFKTYLVMLLTRGLVKASRVVAMRTGLLLAQAGEFGFVLITQAVGLIPDEISQLILAAMVVSMALSPFIVRYNERLARVLLFSKHRQYALADESRMVAEVKDIKDHVLICGYGRVGQSVARLLREEKIPFLALDLDPIRVRDARSAGEPVYYGDATREPILKAMGIMRAKLAAVTFDNTHAALKVLKSMRQLTGNLPILVRAQDDHHLEVLQEAGATEVIPETLEGSLMLSAQLLVMLGVPTEKVAKHINHIRNDRYQLLSGFFQGEDDPMWDHIGGFRSILQPITIAEDSSCVQMAVADCIKNMSDVQMIALIRGHKRHMPPDANMCLQAGDVLVLQGKVESLLDAKKILQA